MLDGWSILLDHCFRKEAHIDLKARLMACICQKKLGIKLITVSSFVSYAGALANVGAAVTGLRLNQAVSSLAQHHPDSSNYLHNGVSQASLLESEPACKPGRPLM